MIPNPYETQDLGETGFLVEGKTFPPMQPPPPSPFSMEDTNAEIAVAVENPTHLPWRVYDNATFENTKPNHTLRNAFLSLVVATTIAGTIYLSDFGVQSYN